MTAKTGPKRSPVNGWYRKEAQSQRGGHPPFVRRDYETLRSSTTRDLKRVECRDLRSPLSGGKTDDLGPGVGTHTLHVLKDFMSFTLLTETFCLLDSHCVGGGSHCVSLPVRLSGRDVINNSLNVYVSSFRRSLTPRVCTLENSFQKNRLKSSPHLLLTLLSTGPGDGACGPLPPLCLVGPMCPYFLTSRLALFPSLFPSIVTVPQKIWYSFCVVKIRRLFN